MEDQKGLALRRMEKVEMPRNEMQYSRAYCIVAMHAPVADGHVTVQSTTNPGE